MPLNAFSRLFDKTLIRGLLPPWRTFKLGPKHRGGSCSGWPTKSGPGNKFHLPPPLSMFEPQLWPRLWKKWSSGQKKQKNFQTRSRPQARFVHSAHTRALAARTQGEESISVKLVIWDKDKDGRIWTRWWKWRTRPGSTSYGRRRIEKSGGTWLPTSSDNTASKEEEEKTEIGSYSRGTASRVKMTEKKTTDSR